MPSDDLTVYLIDTRIHDSENAAYARMDYENDPQFHFTEILVAIRVMRQRGYLYCGVLNIAQPASVFIFQKLFTSMIIRQPEISTGVALLGSD